MASNVTRWVEVESPRHGVSLAYALRQPGTNQVSCSVVRQVGAFRPVEMAEVAVRPS